MLDRNRARYVFCWGQPEMNNAKNAGERVSPLHIHKSDLRVFEIVFPLSIIVFTGIGADWATWPDVLQVIDDNTTALGDSLKPAIAISLIVLFLRRVAMTLYAWVTSKELLRQGPRRGPGRGPRRSRQQADSAGLRRGQDKRRAQGRRGRGSQPREVRRAVIPAHAGIHRWHALRGFAKQGAPYPQWVPAPVFTGVTFFRGNDGMGAGMTIRVGSQV